MPSKQSSRAAGVSDGLVGDGPQEATSAATPEWVTVAKEAWLPDRPPSAGSARKS